jgi:integrase
MARAWFEGRAKGQVDSRRIETVTEAADEYLSWMRIHRRSPGSAESVFRAHIYNEFKNVRIDDLTPTRIRRWHENLAKAPARLRSCAYRPANVRQATTDEMRRSRKATANRVLTNLKAALNHCWREGLIASDAAWRSVRPFHGVEAPRIRFLSKEQSAQLVSSCDAAFRPMVQAALLTGCRYGELAEAKAEHFNALQGTLYIPRSKSGKSRDVVLGPEGRRFFEQIVRLKPAGSPMLPRPDGQQWKPSQQNRYVMNACKKAEIAPVISFHILRHTYASLMVMEGVTLQVISKNLGHADTRMTERHYAHLASSFIADMIRTRSPELGIVANFQSDAMTAPDTAVAI